MATTSTSTSISNPEPSIVPGLNYNLVIHRDKTPELRSPNKVDHKDLQRGKYYFVVAKDRANDPVSVKYIGAVTFVPSPRQYLADGSIDYAVFPPLFREIFNDGTFDVAEEIGQFDELYLCKNKKCQDTGSGHSEQAGGKSRKRYPKTKKRKVRKAKKNTRKQ